MKVQILRDGKFSRFNIPGYRHRVGVQQLVTGDVVDFPGWYAESIVKSGLAVAYVELPIPAFEETYEATAAAEKLAAQEGIDLRTVVATGKGGRITARDVRKAAG